MSSNVGTLTPGTTQRLVQNQLRTVRRAFAALGASLLLYGVCSAQVQASAARAIQPLAEIRNAAEEFVRTAAHAKNANAIATAETLDPRLQFTACAGPLEAFALQGATIGARNTIGVRCNVGAEWTLYVPVRLASDVDVLVLQTAASRDAQLSAADVVQEKRRVPGLGSLYVDHSNSLARKRTKRSLAAGTVLTVDMFNRELAVKRGQQVFLVSNAGGIEVRAPGVAMTAGGMADRIRVQNSSSLKVVEGIVESGNLVRVGM